MLFFLMLFFDYFDDFATLFLAFSSDELDVLGVNADAVHGLELLMVRLLVLFHMLFFVVFEVVPSVTQSSCQRITLLNKTSLRFA